MGVSCTDLALDKKDTFGNFTNPNRGQFELSSTYPENSELNLFVIIVQSSHLTKQYFDNFATTNFEQFEFS